MKIVENGHKYEVSFLSPIKGDSTVGKGFVQFVSRHPHSLKEGTTCQELLRVLIDRVKFLEKEKSWPGNVFILKFLRMALVLFECRNLIIKTEEGDILPEHIKTNSLNLHFHLEEQ